MKIIQTAILIGTLFTSGCATRLTGEYSPSILAKQPWVLTVKSDDTYTWQQLHRPESVVETGRWWKVTSDVIIILPDAPDLNHRFAKLQREQFRLVQFSDGVRELIDGSSQPSAAPYGLTPASAP